MTEVSEKFYLSNKLPPYVFNVVNEMKAEARRRGEDIVDLGMGNPDLATPEPVVNKMIEAALNPRNHRYSASRGIPKLREAFARRYLRRWGVSLDPDREVVTTIGAKEGLAHLMMTVLEPGGVALVPEPAYPIHCQSVTIAGGRLLSVAASSADDLLDKVADAMKRERPQVLLISFPNNPTGECVSINFFKEIIRLAHLYDALVIHDFAYADIVFDGYRAPSILEVEGAKEVAVEIFSMSKSYNMAGWRVGFCAGNRETIAALTRVKSYMDYGIFQPIQIASIIALNECDEFALETAREYQRRRDVLVDTLAQAGWVADKPQGSMFVWAAIPERFRAMGSLEFAKLLLSEAQVAVSPGIGFGESGDGFVRFALVENEQRIRQAMRSVKRLLKG
jgi:alanine-synthesizing transaminase